MPEKYGAPIEMMKKKKKIYQKNTSDLTACTSQPKRPPSSKLAVLQGLFYSEYNLHLHLLCSKFSIILPLHYCTPTCAS